ncbi:hypothetical protein [Sphingomonas edaphi]|uniref:Uncharacterized protein n=1 Tax=Sphingomonas edaphi TaxID=2315689 RepID=A0A418PYF3_9SPHN|nr:hypothetical protein [Sphingomonas edaphi]RIX27002.1 hypothetical protein D3M59_10620 [Sphingomonas edaphi]
MRAVRNVAAAVSALALVAVPTASIAARPSAAVPTAAASSVSAAQPYGGSSAFAPWPAYAIIALTLAFGVWIATKGNDSDSSPISRG